MVRTIIKITKEEDSQRQLESYHTQRPIVLVDKPTRDSRDISMAEKERERPPDQK